VTCWPASSPSAEGRRNVTAARHGTPEADRLPDDPFACLACPYCGLALTRAGSALRCARGHAFDVARQGYVNLVRGGVAPAGGDTAEMVQARADFLGAGHYEPIAGALADLAAQYLAQAETPPAGCVIDVGAGTGYYLARVLDTLPGRAGLALDASKYAARRAAGAHDRAGAVVCDTWSALPVQDGSVALVLDVFAPRNAQEFRRVLSAGGLLVVVTPKPPHLREIVAPLGLLTVDAQKDERIASQLGGLFAQVESVAVETQMCLSRLDVQSLVRMGPSARHAGASALAARIEALSEPLEVTASVKVSAYVAVDEGRAGSDQ
jgi:23S rRNA (guanine745-N1)-methyltransferase